MMNKTKHTSPATLGSALGVLAARECRALLRALAMRKARQEGIHEARKSCRRLRSLLPLLPPEQPIDAVDHGLRELAHGIAPLRDAHIAVRTAKLLANAHETRITPHVIEALQQRCERMLDEALKHDPQWRQRRAEAQRVVTAVTALSWQDISPSLAKQTLKHSKRRVKKARRKTLALRTPGASHRWRRRARELRYQLEFVRKARRMAGMKKRRTQKYGEQAKHLATLTDQLGWRQDFQIFLGAVQELADSADVRALRRDLSSKSANWAQAELR
jgi:CHAD domain-containing protein